MRLLRRCQVYIVYIQDRYSYVVRTRRGNVCRDIGPLEDENI